MKTEEYMESELSRIFRVKLFAKNIVLGSPRTYFMHVRVKMSIDNVILERFIKCLMLFWLPVNLTSIYIIVRFGKKMIFPRYFFSKKEIKMFFFDV